MKGQSSQLLALLLLLLIVGGGLFFVRPMQAKLSDARDAVDVKSAELQTLQGQLDDLQALADEVAQSSAKKTALLKAVPVGHMEDELILELTQLTEKMGFGANALNFALTTDQNLGNSISMAANFQGQYKDLITFLQELENADRLFQVTSIGVQRTSTEEMVFNLNLEAYYQ